jgi:hypothetical protein
VLMATPTLWLVEPLSLTKASNVTAPIGRRNHDAPKALHRRNAWRRGGCRAPKDARVRLRMSAHFFEICFLPS